MKKVKSNAGEDAGLFLSRELSWLDFNSRVLDEAGAPANPLLERLKREAPGTFFHSLMVATLVEDAAREIGANPLKAKAGALFHDIGKLKRPLYFKENQIGDNPHEHTNPYVSAAIVTALRTSEHLPARYRIEAVGYGAGKRPYEGCSGTLRCLLVHADA